VSTFKRSNICARCGEYIDMHVIKRVHQGGQLYKVLHVCRYSVRGWRPVTAATIVEVPMNIVVLARRDKEVFRAMPTQRTVGM